MLPLISDGAVTIRPLQSTDAEALIGMLGDADLMRFALRERPYARAEAEEFLGIHFTSSRALGFWPVTVSSTDEPIGFCALKTCHYFGPEEVDFGWVIAAGHQGRGYATRLGHLLIAHALESVGLARVFAGCHPNNAASEHVLRDKLRMRFEQEVVTRQGLRRRVYVTNPDRHPPVVENSD